jgi:hypothetical protein
MDDSILRGDVRDRLTNGDLIRLYDYWQARHRDGRLPGRADIDPMELRFLLGNLLLVDVLRDPQRFRYRLAGSNLTRFLKRDPTGRLVDEHPDPTFRQMALAIYGEVTSAAKPLATRRNTVIDNRLRRYETLLLPLAGDGVTVDMILVGMRFDT